MAYMSVREMRKKTSNSIDRHTHGALVHLKAKERDRTYESGGYS